MNRNIQVFHSGLLVLNYTKLPDSIDESFIEEEEEEMEGSYSMINNVGLPPQRRHNAMEEAGNNEHQDPRLRRRESNKVSSMKSRLKKAQAVTEMEIKVIHLEATIASLTPQIASEQQLINILQIENESMMKQLSMHAEVAAMKQGQIEGMEAEINRLKQRLIPRQEEAAAAADDDDIMRFLNSTPSSPNIHFIMDDDEDGDDVLLPFEESSAAAQPNFDLNLPPV